MEFCILGFFPNHQTFVKGKSGWELQPREKGFEKAMVALKQQEDNVSLCLLYLLVEIRIRIPTDSNKGSCYSKNDTASAV